MGFSSDEKISTANRFPLATQRMVGRSTVSHAVGGTPVVACEEYNRVVFESIFSDRVHELPD